MNDQVAGQIVEAYKTSPLLTGLLLLNAAFLAGFGYYLIKKDRDIAGYVVMVRADQRALEQKLIDIALQCGK